MPDLQPWILVVIAAVGVMIAYFQWRTAHQRVVLDLFDRRLRVFEQAEKATTSIVQSAKPSMEELRQLHEAKGNARFLFGEDVNKYLTDRIADCAFLLAFTHEAINEHPKQERHKLIDKKYNALSKLADFQKDAPSIFAPYMRLDQKMPSAWYPF